MSVPETMKALVAYSATEYRFESAYPTPECGPDDVVIKTEGCGVCAGDPKCKHGAAIVAGKIVKERVQSRLVGIGPNHRGLGVVGMRARGLPPKYRNAPSLARIQSCSFWLSRTST